MMKNILATIGGIVVTWTVCKLYGRCVHGYYAGLYEEKLEAYKRGQQPA